MNPKSLCQSAGQLSGMKQLKQLALLYIGVILGANLLLLLSDLLISQMMADAVGLAALGKRSVLMTVQTLLQLAVSAAVPFWSYSFYQAAILTARQQIPGKQAMLSGFHRFGPLLRMLLLEGLIATGYMMLASIGASMLYMMSPLAERAMNEIAPILMEAESLTSDPEALNALMEPAMEQLIKNLWPMYLLMIAAMGVLLIPWLYKLRLAPYHILDGENSALQAMAKSQHEMYGNRFTMFKLDLCWWWYYGLLTLSALPLYAAGFFGYDNLLFWVLTLCGFGIQFLIQWQLHPRVQASYALAYDQLKKEPQQ